MDPRSPEAPVQRPGMLERLGLHRRELRAWAMYDFAASGVQTTIQVAVFPLYFMRVAGADFAEPQANQYLAYANSLSIAIVALISPILGAIADYSAVKKRMLGTFLGVGVTAAALMFFIERGDIMLAAALFVATNVAVAGSFVFYESLLPHIASEEEVDRVSTAGFALGYFGGGILLALNLAWILNPGLFGLPSESTLPTRLALASVAVWWLAFSIPLFRHVREPARMLELDEQRGENPVRAAFQRLRETFRELRGYKHAFLMLLAFLIYNDGITTIQKMAAPYGAELGISESALIGSILIVQFVGIPFSFLFGGLAGRIGTKTAIFAGLAVYAVISIFGFFMQTATHFFILAMLVGTVQGGTQGLSRSLFSTMIPRHKSGEFFGFFSVFSKFAGIFGPLLFAGMIGLTGSGRYGILSIIAFFFIGGAVLLLVDPVEGERAARAADADTRVATSAGAA
ncbi:MAG TPA: MFS transporter [Gemmatimonadaceae bacterium]|nr:MFS transporter [Gemmatimonadaceae bacterium]